MRQLGLPYRGRIYEPLAPKVGSAAANPLASVPWIAQWKFNNDGNDSIGSNNLTNNNSATFTTGLLGGVTGATALAKASSQYWSITDNVPLSAGDTDMTFCGWFYMTSTPNSSGMEILSKWGSVGQLEYHIEVYDNAGIHFRFHVSNDGTNVASGGDLDVAATLPNDTWHCFICWHDSVANTLNYQLNGGTVQSNSYSSGIFDGSDAFQIGKIGIGTRYFDGRLDNFCVAKSAGGGGGVLSAAQRTAFYNGGSGTETLT